MDRHWYALHVMTGRETEISGVIREQGHASPIVPIRVLCERRHGKRIEKQRTLFPGYVFIHWIPAVSEYYKMTGIPGVIRFVAMAGGVPTAIPDEQMAPVLILANEGNPIALSQAYREGRMTRIRSGPLKDLEAYIVNIDAHNRRATVRIPLLNAEHTVQLGIEMLKPTNTFAPAQDDSSPRMAMGDQG